MRHAKFILVFTATFVAAAAALTPCRAPGAPATVGSQICDSTRALGLYHDSLVTKKVKVDSAALGSSSGKISFFGGSPAAQCTLSHASPPNPVTEAAARAQYDQSIQSCLDENGVNLIGVPQ